MTRASAVAARRRERSSAGRLVFALVAALLASVPLAALASSDVVLRYSLTGSATAGTPLTPLTAATTTAGAGVCRSTATGSVPFGAGSPRGSIAIVEPVTCASRTTLTFLPALQFPNGLSVPAGHVLDVRLNAVSVSGSTAMLRSVHVYVQRVGGGSPIVTGTHVRIVGGVVTVAQSSVAALTAGLTYGIGVRMQLIRPLLASTATLTLVLFAYVGDGGVVRDVVEESATITFHY